MAEIFFFKLYTGEDIIAEMLDEDPEFAFITMPFKIIYERTPSTGKIGASMIQWIPVDSAMNSTITICKDDVIIAVKIDDDQAIKYIEIANKKRVELGIVAHDTHTETIQEITDHREKMKLLYANTPSNFIH